MNDKSSDMATLSIKRDKTKTQISRYLLKNKNQLPENIVLAWREFEEIEEVLKSQQEADLKRIGSTVGKRKNINPILFLLLITLPLITSAFIVRLIKPKMLILNECLENLEECQLTNNQKR